MHFDENCWAGKLLCSQFYFLWFKWLFWITTLMNQGINAKKIKYGSSSLYARFWLFSFDVGQTRCLTKHSWKTNKQYIRKSSISSRWSRVRRRLHTRKMGTENVERSICWPRFVYLFLKKNHIYLFVHYEFQLLFCVANKNRKDLSILRHNTNSHILI